MAKLGVITDGISRDLEHALQVATEHDLEYAELQFVWDKEVGDLDDDQMAKALALVDKYGVKVSSITRHNFVGLLVGEVEVGDAVHQKHMAALQRCIDMAKAFDTKIVRTMSFRKEMIIFGYNGAEDWNASRGAWDKLIELLTPAVKLAEANDIILSVETGNNAMITSAVLARKFIDDMGSDNLKLMWDPANTLYCGEVVYPDGFDALRGGYISHVHIKDCRVDIPGCGGLAVRDGHRRDGALSRGHRRRLQGRELRRRGLARERLPPGRWHLRGRLPRVGRPIQGDLRLAIHCVNCCLTR